MRLSGDTLILRDGGEFLTFESDGRRVFELLSQAGGEAPEASLTDFHLLAPVLEERRWLVRLARPLSEILSQSPGASRQLAYFAQLQRNGPDRSFEELSGARILILGVGGVGSHLAVSLAGSGVGHLTLSDPDSIDQTNLNRQFMYAMSDVGKYKVRVAERFLRDRYPQVDIRSIPERLLDHPTARNVLSEIDLVVFAGDWDTLGRQSRIPTDIPVVSAGYIGSTGIVGPLLDPRAGTACWRCRLAPFDELCSLEAQAPQRETGWNSSGATINGLLGHLAAEVVLRQVAPSLGGPLLKEEILLIDMVTLTVTKERMADVDCPHRS